MYYGWIDALDKKKEKKQEEEEEEEEENSGHTPANTTRKSKGADMMDG